MGRLLRQLNQTIKKQNIMVKKNSIKPALLVIDVQKISLNYIPETDIEPALVVINMYIERFRSHGCPIIRIYHHNPLLQGDWTEDFEFPESLKIQPGDPKIVKTRPDAFHKTELNEVLRKLGCNTLFVCGLSATGCALATWIGAFNFDYHAFLIKDALMSPKKAHTENIESMFDAVGPDVIKLVLENVG